MSGNASSVKPRHAGSSGNVLPFHKPGLMAFCDEAGSRAKLALALELAAAGWPVFPCAGKAPAIEGGQGFRDATTDATTIRRWWADHPDAQVGVWPGACNPPLVVLDVDCKKGAKGYQSLARLEEEGVIPKGGGYRVTTPSGGLHIYFALPPGTPEISNRDLADGINIRAHGGYVIWYAEDVPEDWEVPEAPAALLARLGEAKTKVENTGEPAEGVELDTPEQVLRAAELARRLRAEGPKDRYRKACRVIDEGTSAAECHRIMRMVGFDEDGQTTLTAKIASAFRNRQNAPGSAVAERQASLEQMKAMAAADALPRDPAGAAKQMKAPTLVVLTGDELDAIPAARAIIKNVLHERTLSFIVGPSDRYKSFLAQDQAGHIALGMDWAGQKVREARDVLYVAAEGASGLKHRRQAWVAKHGATPDRLRFIADMPLWVEGGHALLSATLDACARQGFTPAVVYIDTLASYAAGLDESASKDMGPLVATCRKLSAEHHCAVVLIHHTGKDEKRGARGWSGLKGAADALLEVSAEQ